jgi:2-iminobutanoate/2-iminopropanoate deaminase
LKSIKRVNWIEGVPKPRASYSSLVRAGDFVFTAGHVGMDPKTGKVAKQLETQLHIIFETIKKLLESEGGSLDHVVKTTTFLTDASYHETYDRIYRSYFKNGYPARSTVETKLMHPDFKAEIEAVAYIPKKSSNT